MKWHKKKTLILDDLKGHWQPVRSAILTTAGFFCFSYIAHLRRYLKARTERTGWSEQEFQFSSVQLSLAVQGDCHGSLHDDGTELNCYNVSAIQFILSFCTRLEELVSLRRRQTAFSQFATVDQSQTAVDAHEWLATNSITDWANYRLRPAGTILSYWMYFWRHVES